MNLVLRGGAVFTADAAGSIASAIAVVDGRVAAVGGDADIAPYLREADEVVDLDGRLVVPGFVDAHNHAVFGGLERSRCDLTECHSVAEVQEQVATYAARHPEREWILGGGWSMETFPGGLPHRGILDAVVPDRPARLPNRDHHSTLVNTEALRRAGITRETSDPADGRIERDERGEPTGLLHEGAATLVEHVLPEDTQDELDDALRTALTYLHSMGVTGWQDAMVTAPVGAPSNHAAYLRAAAEGWLTARVSGALWWERDTPPDLVAAEVERLGAIRASVAASPFYGVHSVKLMQDGVAETFTAALLEPYLDRCGHPTENHGMAFLPPGLLQQVVIALDAAAFQVHFHALGDKAVRDVLDAIEAAQHVNGTADRRHHLAHLQMVHERDVARFHQLGAAANLQALWAAHEPQLDELTSPFLGGDRAERQYPFGELARAGAPLVMGSDWPVSSPDPLAAIHVAVNRVDPTAPAQTSPLGRDQELTLGAALRAYTAGSAWVNRREGVTGTLAAGALADLVVLDRNPFLAPASEIAMTRVDHTFVDGDQVYAADQPASSMTTTH